MANKILLYGPSGSWKTSNVGQYAEFLHARYGGVTRAVYGDNSGPIKQQIDDGIVKLWDLLTEDDPLGCVMLASMGYWPNTLVDGHCVDYPVLTKDWTGIAGYAIEGFHEIGQLIMRRMEKKQQSTGEPLAGVFGDALKFQGLKEDLKLQYAMASRGTFFFVQNQTHRYFKLGFAGLPVPWILVTTHEFRGDDKSGKKVVGPGLVGKASTGVIGQWFDHVLHFEQVIYDLKLSAAESKLAGVGTVKRVGSLAHFAKHSDKENPLLMWPAKLGVEPYLQSYIYSKWPSGAIPLVLKANGDEPAEYVSSVRSLLEVIDPMPEGVK